MNVREMHQQNRRAWNEGAVRYAEEVERDIAFLRLGDRNFVAPEFRYLADLVYTGRGALYWITDLESWARVVARLLAPGGRLYVFEGHPLTWIFDVEAAEIRLDPVYSDYFAEKIDVGAGWPETYIGALDRPKAALTPKYERQWTLGQILNPLIDAGLRVERFEEHPDLYWAQFPNMPEEIARHVPQTFSLLMRNE